MKPNVVSLDMAKKLKAQGYPQEDSYFFWDMEGIQTNNA